MEKCAGNRRLSFNEARSKENRAGFKKEKKETRVKMLVLCCDFYKKIERKKREREKEQTRREMGIRKENEAEDLDKNFCENIQIA